MAAYAATVSSLMQRAVKVDQVVGVGVYAGNCNLSNYNSTLAEITAITKKFQSVVAVVAEGVSDTGYLIKWDATSKAFKAYYPAPQHSHGLIVTKGAIGANLEVGLSADAAAATLNNNTIAATLTLNAPDPVANAAAAAGTEVANDVDVGAFDFIAVGII